MRRMLERAAIAALAAAAAFAVATTTGQGGNQRGGFIDIPRGGYARFLGTSTLCLNPRRPVPAGQVACIVYYRERRSLRDSVPMKFTVGLTLRCVDLGKWSRSRRLLTSTRFC